MVEHLAEGGQVMYHPRRLLFLLRGSGCKLVSCLEKGLDLVVMGEPLYAM